MMFNKFFNSLDTLNQAIQPKVVGPLFKKGGIDLCAAKLFGIGLGTSIDQWSKVRGPRAVGAGTKSQRALARCLFVMD